MADSSDSECGGIINFLEDEELMAIEFPAAESEEAVDRETVAPGKPETYPAKEVRRSKRLSASSDDTVDVAPGNDDSFRKKTKVVSTPGSKSSDVDSGASSSNSPTGDLVAVRPNVRVVARRIALKNYDAHSIIWETPEGYQILWVGSQYRVTVEEKELIRRTAPTLVSEWEMRLPFTTQLVKEQRLLDLRSKKEIHILACTTLLLVFQGIKQTLRELSYKLLDQVHASNDYGASSCTSPVQVLAESDKMNVSPMELFALLTSSGVQVKREEGDRRIDSPLCLLTHGKYSISFSSLNALFSKTPGIDTPLNFPDRSWKDFNTSERGMDFNSFIPPFTGDILGLEETYIVIRYFSNMNVYSNSPSRSPDCSQCMPPAHCHHLNFCCEIEFPLQFSYYEVPSKKTN